MKQHKNIVSAVWLFVLFGAIGLATYNRQYIYDWYRLRNYVPIPSIASLATATTMSDGGRRLFYVYRPELNDKDTFNLNCTDSEKSIVLGCYVQNKGIYLYDVTDDRLKGVEEVTAAHEMLHAGYDRLSNSERRRINALTEKVYSQLKDERIQKTVQSYREKDASVVPNELHSIIGTEVRELPVELETYYKRYFTNRLTVVEFSEKYESVFDERETQAAAYKLQLDTLRAQIETTSNSLDTRAKELAGEYAQLESQRSSADPATFNARVRAYNAGVNAYNANVKTASSKIDEYNKILEQYNAIVIEENELIKAIDSRPATIDAQ